MWNPIQSSDIQAEILPDEVSLLNTIEGSSAILYAILFTWVNKCRAMIEVGGNNLDVPGTVPDQLRPEIIAIVRWRWFSALPKTDLQSDARKQQFDEAMKIMNEVQAGKIKVEFPSGIAGGPAGQMQVASGGRRKTSGIGGAV